jgi:CHAT domain-containing protein
LVETGRAFSAETPYSELPYLMQNHVVGYASSATAHLYAQGHPVQAQGTRMLAFAPSFDNEPMYADAGRSALTALKHASKEVEAISQYFKGDVVVGEQATEQNFKSVMGNYNILHFATHGTIADENPMWSGISFTQTKDSVEDGMLQTMELFGMKLNADMAVLSACNTGRGKLVKGEGIMSLARGFMYAGCPSIVMSLYAVDDAATSSIMEGFYKALAKGQDKDLALQTAKKDYLLSHSDIKCHPYYWAAHVLIGAPEGFGSQQQGLTWLLMLGGLLALILWDELRRG